MEYKNSGEPAVYNTHQEIMLELWKGWAQMAKWGECDFSEFEELERKFEKLAKTDIEKFFI